MLDSFPFAPRTLPAAAAGFAALGLAWRLLRGEITSGETETVLRGVPDNVTTEMDLRLWDLAGSGAPTRPRPRCSARARRPSW